MNTRKVGNYLRTLEKIPKYHILSNQIKDLNELHQLFMATIPAQLQKSCVLGLPQNKKLVVFAKNASAAARLKQISPTLLKRMKDMGGKITSIHIAVQAYHHSMVTDTATKKHAQISSAGKIHLNEFANSLPASELKSAIESLIKRT